MVVGVTDSYSGNAATGALLKTAAAVERAKRHFSDGFVRPREVRVEDRQYAVEVLLLQIDFHVFGDEVGRLQGGFHRVFQISERTGEIRDAQRIRRRSHRFLPAKNVHRSLGKKLIDIEKIRPTEHVKYHGDRLHRFRKVRRLPLVQFLKLPEVKL